MKYADEQCLRVLKLSRKSGIAELYICWSFFYILWSVPLIKIKIVLALEKSFWLKYINTHLNSCETVPLKRVSIASLTISLLFCNLGILNFGEPTMAGSQTMVTYTYNVILYYVDTILHTIAADPYIGTYAELFFVNCDVSLNKIYILWWASLELWNCTTFDHLILNETVPLNKVKQNEN